MAKIGSAQPPPPPPGGRGRLGGAIPGGGDGSNTPPPPPLPPAGSAGTLAQRLENATRAGALTAVPAAYADGQDWETVLSDDVFARLYLAAALHGQVTDAQVQANLAVLAGFWRGKLNRFITGDRDVEDVYRPGTVQKADDQLMAAATALADAAGRAACFQQLEERRRKAAGEKLEVHVRLMLQSPVIGPSLFRAVLAEGEGYGFTPAEAEQYVLRRAREAGYAPVKTINQSPNLLLAEWTPGGVPLTNRPSTKVMGNDVYSLAEAAQVLYGALASVSERDKAQRNLDSSDYLASIAADLKERDAQQDINDLFKRVALPREQRRLSALYLFGPGLPFHLDNGLPAFASPAELLARTAASAADFAAAEAAYVAGLLPIWLQAAGTAGVKAALPATKSQSATLDLRRFLHAAQPDFPLWLGSTALRTPAELAAYIRRDEQSWEMVYGSLSSGNLAPWLAARGQGELLAEQARLAGALLGHLDPASAAGRRLAVQALLEALAPQVPTPALVLNQPGIDLTSLSGETPQTRTLTITNTTGGPMWVRLALQEALEGVQVAPTELFFDQRAPGQHLHIALTGNPAVMPRDGRHQTALLVSSCYGTRQVPVLVEAVFPQKEFWQFVGGAALTLAAIFGGVRWLLGQALGVASYEHMVGRRTLLPLRAAMQAGHEAGFTLVGLLLLLAGLVYGFGRVLRQLAKPRPVL